MKSLLFALGLALCCVVQAERFEDFDHSKINRNQYVVAIATNCQKMKEMLPHMKASPVTFEQLSADEIKMTIDMATPNGCQKMSPVLKRENGAFTTTCGQGGKKTLEQIEMIGTSMYTSINLSHKKGQCKMASLSVTNLADAQAAMEGFRDFADRNSLEEEDVHALSREGICPRSS
ncbi:putative Lipocalin-like toxin protein [Naja naja]|nr:putative Lipocalin-like toxin protein [Naja naja]